MIYLADLANLEELKELFYYFPIAGITTNPTILAAKATNVCYFTETD